MIRYNAKGLEVGEVWFDEEPPPPFPDILIYRHSSSSRGRASVDFLSLVTDLSSPIETLRAGMEKGTRYEIRRADEKDHLGRRMSFEPSSSELAAFLEFYSTFAKSKELSLFDPRWLTAIRNEHRLCLSTAVLSGQPLVWHSYLLTGKTTRLLHSASQSEPVAPVTKALIGRANRWLHWHDICEFKRRGLEFYDWGGLFQDEATPAHRGINAFKRDFGGIERRYFNATTSATLRGALYLSARDTWKGLSSVLFRLHLDNPAFARHGTDLYMTTLDRRQVSNASCQSGQTQEQGEGKTMPTCPPDFRSLVGDRKLVNLSAADLAAPIDPHFQQFLNEAFRGVLDKQTIRILDFGCGRGRLVGQLRADGWTAYGVDIEKRFITCGQVLQELWSDPLPVLSVVGDRGTTIFPDVYFDAVISDQVVEHVADFDAFAAELERILKPGGVVFHRFPGSHRLVEPHYFLPFAHWLPSGSMLRRGTIRLLLMMGLGVKFDTPLAVREKARVVTDYADNHTFYRSPSAIATVFERHGIPLDFHTTEDVWLQQKLKARAPTFLAGALTILLSSRRLCRLLGDLSQWQVTGRKTNVPPHARSEKVRAAHLTG